MATALAQYEQFDPAERKPETKTFAWTEPDPAILAFRLADVMTDITRTPGYMSSGLGGTTECIATSRDLTTVGNSAISRNVAIFEKPRGSEGLLLFAGSSSGNLEGLRNVLVPSGTAISANTIPSGTAISGSSGITTDVTAARV